MALPFIISLILLLVAWIGSAFCMAIMESVAHGKNKWSKKDGDFWSKNADNRKYKEPRVPAPNNWYYKVAVMSDKERFPLAGTILSPFVDGYHASKSLAITCFVISIIVFPWHEHEEPLRLIITILGLRYSWSSAWTIFYKWACR